MCVCVCACGGEGGVVEAGSKLGYEAGGKRRMTNEMILSKLSAFIHIRARSLTHTHIHTQSSFSMCVVKVDI